MHAVRPPADAGFTVIELLIALAMTSLLLAAIFTFAIAQGHYLTTQEQVSQMVQTARAAMDVLTHDLDSAGYNPTGAAFVGVTFNASQLQLLADLSGDGDTADADETIVYTYDATAQQMVRNAGNGNEALASQVSDFTFQYLDATGAATTVSANIRQVRITLTVRTAKPDLTYPTNGGYRTYTLSAGITPRNLVLVNP
jgi:type IV pilus assembly protein PilW